MDQSELNQEFIEAAWRGNLQRMLQCIQQGADVHSDADAALQYSATAGHIQVVRRLIEYGADVCSSSNSALRWSANNGHLDVVHCLIQHGANVHAKDDAALRASATNDHLSIVQLLIQHGSPSEVGINAANPHSKVFQWIQGQLAQQEKTQLLNNVNITQDNSFNKNRL